MTVRRFRVIGPRTVHDVEPGGTLELDDELDTTRALLEGQHVELEPGNPIEPEGATRPRQGRAASRTDGTTPEGATDTDAADAAAESE